MGAEWSRTKRNVVEVIFCTTMIVIFCAMYYYINLRPIARGEVLRQLEVMKAAKALDVKQTH